MMNADTFLQRISSKQLTAKDAKRAMTRPSTMNYCDIYCDIEDLMKTEAIMKDSTYNYKVNERDIYGNISDIYGTSFHVYFYPCASASSAQSVFYSMDNKPQRAQRTQREVSLLCALFVLCGRMILPIAKDFDKNIHHKGRKERKAVLQESLRPLRSLRLNVFSTPAHERAPPAPSVHPRLSRAGG